MPAVRNEDYLDFPPDYNFAADVLANACDTQKGSRASVALTEEDGQDIAKAWVPSTLITEFCYVLIHSTHTYMYYVYTVYTD